MLKTIIPALAASCALLFSVPVTANDWSPAEREFITQMETEHNIPRAKTEELLRQAQLSQPILDAISRPWEARPWHQYYPIFLTERRLQQGIEFWAKHEDTLARAEEKFGVPAEIIVAVLGVETFYGNVMGTHRVLDALYTLGFHYPPRQTFFRSELRQFILLATEENIDPTTIKGSYAGAMGYGQFISSSYRHYAVDFDGDGVRDLMGNVVDGIGSIANYFAEHRWQSNQPVAIPAWVGAETPVTELTAGRGQVLTHTVGELKAAGVKFITAMPDETRARLFAFEEADGSHSYWVGLPNFYAITRYNHSPLYAMAVYQLAQQLRAHR
ncbi:lytic murein transglycosylase B [Aliidiomarina haloalkalitolerans]|uniref:Lytic murein transglycosylase B n=1 Tax=Aliidiomarina haloalkalitolerans TaxID=859059 RepID=A0A432VZB6_9GAMM|nr:lytic murein transglycosylase B [Aliidiomarina haloalkalitolerans]MCL4409899.1 lytic murein transglycosylase B [Gammaproteobacteria bacterium]RUO22000.1 lytic murein transglycosylase B [Aliidiomarina haloalkalitolerans]